VRVCPFSLSSFLSLLFFLSGRPDFTHYPPQSLVLGTDISSLAMGENWFQREFLTPRRLAFNVLFYGSHLFWFAYGWHSQVSS